MAGDDHGEGRHRCGQGGEVGAGRGQVLGVVEHEQRRLATQPPDEGVQRVHVAGADPDGLGHILSTATGSATAARATTITCSSPACRLPAAASRASRGLPHATPAGDGDDPAPLIDQSVEVGPLRLPTEEGRDRAGRRTLIEPAGWFHRPCVARHGATTRRRDPPVAVDPASPA